MPGIKGQPYAKVKALRCYREIYERICAGYPLPEVARYIQEEEGEYTDVTRPSLMEILRGFASDEIISTDLIAPRLPHLVVKAQREFGDRLEDLRRLERVYELQLYRLDLLHAQERRTGHINSEVAKEVRVLVEVIDKMHGIKMDLGLTGSRDLGTLTVSAERLAEIRERYGEGAARAFADPVQRMKVLSLLKRVLRLANRPDLEAELPDGPVIDAVPVEANASSPGEDEEE